MTDVKKVQQCSSNCARQVPSTVFQAKDQEALHLPTAEDVQVLWRLIKGVGSQVKVDEQGVVLAVVGGAALLLGSTAVSLWERENYAHSLSTSPLPEGVLPGELSPLAVTPEGQLRSFGNVPAIEWFLAQYRRVNFRQGTPEDLTGAEIEMFSQRTQHSPHIIDTTLLDGRMIRRYEFTGFPLTPEGGVDHAKCGLKTIYLFEGEEGGRLLGVRVADNRGAVLVDRVDAPVFLEADGSDSGVDGLFLDIEQADRFEKEVRGISSQIRSKYPASGAPTTVELELAKRIMVEWMELSESAQKPPVSGKMSL